jgi:stearoyl-CoA desaturase (delta-9 desaturase)
MVAAGMYLVRMFAITAFYHRYFSHRAFRTTRAVQFAFALLGCSTWQGGPLWWAGVHRLHHRHSDSARDFHSPLVLGWWWVHFGWLITRRARRLWSHNVKDFMRYPELVVLDRCRDGVPLLTAGAMYLLGDGLAAAFPALGTSGPQLLVWGFFVSTICLLQATLLVGSLSHLRGTRRYATNDNSHNNLLVAILTLGEGWHNNHHYSPASARAGHRWWEIDCTYYGLIALSWVGIVWGLKPPKRESRG